jgi:GAF domain-containing protein
MWAAMNPTIGNTHMSSPSANGVARESQVIQTFLELADTLVADFDIIDSLTIPATRCVEILDAAATGILLADTNGQLRVIGASNEQARLLELFQLQNDEGPCMEAFSSGQSVITTDLRGTIDRWPKFTPYAVGAGYESASAIPLRLRGDIIGVLNLFRASAGPLNDGDVALAQAFADLASIAILQAAAATQSRQREDQLQHALDSRIIIEQAKGMLAEHANIDMASAFDHMRALARTTNAKLTSVASRIVDGRLDLDAFATKPSSTR